MVVVDGVADGGSKEAMGASVSYDGVGAGGPEGAGGAGGVYDTALVDIAADNEGYVTGGMLSCSKRTEPRISIQDGYYKRISANPYLVQALALSASVQR